jgi:hypothetical protein
VYEIVWDIKLKKLFSSDCKLIKIKIIMIIINH